MNSSRFKTRLIRLFPWLIRVRQKQRARRDAAASPKSTYSKCGEDKRILDILGRSSLESYTFIDVGGNHPTTQSNTYLFYRLGLSGVVVEPNLDYLPLYRQYRPADEFIPVGCGKEADLKEYKKYTCSAINSFAGAAADEGTIKHAEIVEKVYIPVLPLDLIWSRSSKRDKKIGLLSVDAEGMDLEILQGATSLLPKTAVICIEAAPDRRECLADYLRPFNFAFEERVHANFVFVNRATLG